MTQTQKEWVAKNIVRVRSINNRSYLKNQSERRQRSLDYYWKNREEVNAKRRVKYQERKEAEFLEMWNKKRAT